MSDRLKGVGASRRSLKHNLNGPIGSQNLMARLRGFGAGRLSSIRASQRSLKTRLNAPEAYLKGSEGQSEETEG